MGGCFRFSLCCDCENVLVEESVKKVTAYVWNTKDVLSACFYYKGRWHVIAEIKDEIGGNLRDSFSSDNLDDEMFVSYLQHYSGTTRQ